METKQGLREISNKPNGFACKKIRNVEIMLKVLSDKNSWAKSSEQNLKKLLLTS